MARMVDLVAGHEPAPLAAAHSAARHWYTVLLLSESGCPGPRHRRRRRWTGQHQSARGLL